MAEDQTQIPNLDHEPAGGPPGASEGGNGGLASTPKRKTPKSPGRGTDAEIVARFLAEQGLVAVRPGEAPDGGEPQPGADAPADVEPAKPFDEDKTRSGVTVVVDLLEGVGVNKVASACQAAQLDEPTTVRQCRRVEFGKLRDPLITSGVDICRRHNLSLPPELPVAGILATWVRELRATVEEIKRLAPKGGQA